MPKRKTNATKVRSKLAQVRVERDVSQAALAEAIDIHIRTLQELERGWVTNPGITTLTRIAYALDVPIEAICEDNWLSVTWDKQIRGTLETEKKSVPRLVKRAKS